MQQQEIELIDYIRVLWRQKWIIVATLVVAVVSAWLFSEMPETTYRTSAALFLMPTLSTDLDADGVSGSMPARAYEELALSTTVLRLTLELAGLSSEISLEQLRAMLSVTSDLLSEGATQRAGEPILLHLSARGSNPDYLELIAQSWIPAYAQTHESLFRDRAAAFHDFILQNYEETEAELSQLVLGRTGFLVEYPIDGMKIDWESLRRRLLLAQEMLAETTANLTIARTYLESHGIPSLPEAPTFVLSDEIDPYTLSGALLLGLTPGQFDALLSARIDGLRSEIDDLRAALQDKQYEIDAAQAGLDEFDREIDLLGETAQLLSSRLQIVGLAVAEDLDPIRVIDEPIVSVVPMIPKMTTNMGVAAFLGLILGTLLAFFVDYLQRVHERERIMVAETERRAREQHTDNDQDRTGQGTVA